MNTEPSMYSGYRYPPEIISRAEKRGAEIIEEAKNDAVEEGNRIKAAAQLELEREVNRAKETLRGQVVEIATAGAGRILKRKMENSTQDITELEGDAELARPYARAVFELAKDSDQLQSWSDRLALMAAVVSNETMHAIASL